MNEHSWIPSEDYGEARRVCEYCGVYEDYKEIQCTGPEDIKQNGGDTELCANQ